MTVREFDSAAYISREVYILSHRRRRSLAVIGAVGWLLLTAWMIGPRPLTSSLDLFAPLDARGVFDGE
jgi:hypothetical protein